MSPRTLLRACAVLGLAGVSLAQSTPIDLSTWTTVQYEFNFQPDASWDLQPGNTAVLQSINSDASIFLSGFDAAGQSINGTWRCETTNDDDFMGFVFGYQGRGQYYLFDWKKSDQNHAGFSERGMTLKVVHTPLGTDPVDTDLWPTAGSANVTPLLHNTIPWVTNVTYDFTLLYTPGNIEVTVKQGAVVLEHWNVSDTTYSNGKFGFYNYSQNAVRYEGFTQTDVITYYCTAKTNSQGCLPAIDTVGFPSLSDAAPFTVLAVSLVNQMNGNLFLSRTGAAALPFNGGLLCLAAPILDTPLVHTGGSAVGLDCSGSLSFDLNGWLQAGGAPGLVAGDTLWAQYFYRDIPHPDGTGTGMTAALELVVQP
jgi:hypothetical protein